MTGGDLQMRADYHLHCEFSDDSRERMETQIEQAIALGLEEICRYDRKGIELNTSSWKYGLPDTQPSRDILRLYKDLGGRIITVGSDAHTSARMGDHLEEAYRILRDEIGFTHICTFDKMEPVFHSL
jgi:histidinol-phosphatase (PHP family)